MKLKHFGILLFITLLFIDASHLTLGDHGHLNTESDSYDQDDRVDQLSPSNDYMSRFLAHSHGKRASCRWYPFICRFRGSAGPDCCGHSCVNVFTDQRNCGRCGKKCRHGETCCGGECVNLSFNSYHCGRCFNRCNDGDSCAYGLCDYA